MWEKLFFFHLKLIKERAAVSMCVVRTFGYVHVVALEGALLDPVGLCNLLALVTAY